VTPENYREFAQFLTQLTQYVETHFQSRRLGTIVVENQRLQHLLKFTSDLGGSLDSLEVARLAANYGRDLIGCERCSVAEHLIVRSHRSACSRRTNSESPVCRSRLRRSAARIDCTSAKA